MQIWRTSLTALLMAVISVGPLHATGLSPDERKARNLETLKSDQYYLFMDGVDRVIADGLGFDDSAFEKLNDLFRSLKQQNPERYVFLKKYYPDVFENLEVE